MPGRNGSGMDENEADHEVPMVPGLRQEIERGLRFAHIMLDVNQRQGKASGVVAQALANLLLAKGIISEEELRQSMAEAEEEAAGARQPRVRVGDMGDKYADTATVEIDCMLRIHLCQARCCTFKFYLTKQDLDEGAARWDYGNPYWVDQGADGYCVHCDPATRACTIHAQRPHVCRLFDCRKDSRVWIDFEQRIPALMPETSPNPPPAMTELAMRSWREETNEGEEESAE